MTDIAKALEVFENLPEVTTNPCSDCPWRIKSVKGWLGPHDAYEWLKIVHGESPIACHQTIRETDDDGVGDWLDGVVLQCKGAAIYRANVAKLPVHKKVAVGPVDRVTVFPNDGAFIDHHTTSPMYREMYDDSQTRNSGRF